MPPATHRQALSALLFLYKEVLGRDLPWMAEIGRPAERRRIPAVLTVAEVQRVLERMDGVTGLLARLLYGSGMRMAEALALRVKDVYFARRVVVVRSGKGGKDRVVMLPAALAQPLQGPAPVGGGARTVASRSAGAAPGGGAAACVGGEGPARWGGVGVALGVSFAAAVGGSALGHRAQAPSA